MKRWFIFLAVLLILGVIGGAGYLGYRASLPATTEVIEAPPTIPVDRGSVVQRVSAPGQLVAMREQLLSFPIGGQLSALNVRAGDTVKAGDVLANLDDSALQYTIQVALVNLESAEAKLNKLSEPASDAAITAAQAQITAAQAAYDAAVAKNAHAGDQITLVKAALEHASIALQQAQSDYDQVAWRNDVGMTPQSAALQQATIDYESAVASYNLAAAEINDSAVQATIQATVQTLVQAQSNLVQLTAPPSPQDIAVAQADVEKAKIELLEAADNRLNHTKLIAPFDGVIQEVNVKAGETVSAGAPVLQLMAPESLEARLTLTEEDYPLVQVGQSAQVYFDSQPEVVITGTVTAIAPLRDANSDSPLYPVYIAFDQDKGELPAGLAPGMTVDASLLIAERTDVLRLPRALASARSDGSAQIEIWANGARETRTIETDLRGDQYIEILSGVDEGEEVVSR